MPGICIPGRRGCKGWFGIAPECRACREIGSFDSSRLLFYFILSTSNLYSPGDKLRQFSATRLQDFSFYLYRARQRRTGSIELFASIRRGRFLATSEIFVSPLVNSRIFLKRDIKSRKLYNPLYRFLEINSINGFAIKLNSPSRISLAPVNDRYLSRIWTVQVFQQ